MKFNTAYQRGTINFNGSFQKIRALVGIIPAWMNNLQPGSIFGIQIVPVKILELPDKLKKPFSHVKKGESYRYVTMRSKPFACQPVIEITSVILPQMATDANVNAPNK